DSRRRNTWVGRGVWLRQDYAGEAHSEAGKAHVRASSLRGAGYKLCGESRDEAGPTQDAGHLSGPIFLVEPAKNNREHYHGAFDHSSDRDPFPTTGEAPGPDGRCRSKARVLETVPTRVLRRSEAANRNRTSAGSESQSDHRGRACISLGCLDPLPGVEPYGGLAR